MSTHIHKVMGYGAKHPNKQQVFSRLENSQPNEVHNLLHIHYLKMKETNERGHRQLGWHLNLGDKTKYPDTLSDVVHYAEHPDYDDGYTVITTPLNFLSWYRWSDDIDWYEESLDDDSIQTKVKWLNKPIYPYSEWMHKDTGEVLSHDDGLLIYETNNYAPYVPISIQIIANEIGFEDWKVLRPVIISWWC